MANAMYEEENQQKIKMVPVDEGSDVNIDTASMYGLSFRDFPEIRESIRKYAIITVAAQMILDERSRQAGNSNRKTVLLVRDTKELLVDGRPSIDVVYSTSVSMPLQNGTASYTEHTQVPIETISELVSRLEKGDVPFEPGSKAALSFGIKDIHT